MSDVPTIVWFKSEEYDGWRSLTIQNEDGNHNKYAQCADTALDAAIEKIKEME